MTNYGDQNIASFEGYKETERGIFTAGGRQHLVMFYVMKVSRSSNQRACQKVFMDVFLFFKCL